MAAPSSASMAQSHLKSTSPSPMDRLVRLILPTPRSSMDSTSSDDESGSEAYGQRQKRKTRSKTAPQQSFMRSSVPDIGESPYNTQARKYSSRDSSAWVETRATRQNRLHSNTDTYESNYSRSSGRGPSPPSNAAPALRNPWTFSSEASPNPNDAAGSYVESLGLDSRAFPSPSTPPTSVWSTPMLQQTLSKQSKQSAYSKSSNYSPQTVYSPVPGPSIRPVLKQRRSSVSDMRSLNQDYAPLPAPPITSPPTAPATQSSFRRAFSKSKSKPNIGKFEWESSEDEYSDHEQLPYNAARFKEKAARLAREDDDNSSVRRVLREAAEFQAERERDGWASEGGGLRRRKKQKRRRRRRGDDPPLPPPSSRPGIRRANSAGPGLESPPMNTSCDFFLPTRALRSFRKRSNSESSVRPPTQGGWFGRKASTVPRAPPASRDMGTQVDEDFLRFGMSPQPIAGPSNTYLQVPAVRRQRSSSFSDVPSLTPSGREVGYGLAISGSTSNPTMYNQAEINSSVERLAVSSPPSKHHTIRTSAAGKYLVPTRRIPSPLPLPLSPQRYQPSPIPFPEDQYESGYFKRGATPSALPSQLSLLPIYGNNPLFHQDRALPALPMKGRQSLNSSKSTGGRRSAPSRVSGESEQDHVLNCDEGEQEFQNLFYSRPSATSAPTAVAVASTSAATSPQTLRFSFDSNNRSEPSTSQTTNEYAEDEPPRKLAPIASEPPKLSPLRNEKSFSASLHEELTPSGRLRSHSAGAVSSKQLSHSTERQEANHRLPHAPATRSSSQVHHKQDSTGSIPPIQEVTVLRSPTLIRNSAAERWRASSIIPDLNDSEDEADRLVVRRTRSSDESAANSFIDFDFHEPETPHVQDRNSYMDFDPDSPLASPEINDHTFGIAPATTPSFPSSVKQSSPEVTIREDSIRHSFASTVASESPSHSHHLSVISPSTVRGSAISMGSSTTSLGKFSFPHPPSPSESQYKRSRTTSLPPSNELERRSRLSEIGLRTSTSSPLGYNHVR